MDDFQKLQARVDKMERQMNDPTFGVGATTALGAPPTPIDFQPVAPDIPIPPASNQIRNGDASHSVNTYKETVAAPGTDKVLECAYWFTHSGPAATGDVLDVVTDAITNSVNKTLKAVGHSNYDVTFPDWGLPAGTIRLTGVKTIDAPFPNNSVYPGRTMYLGAIGARRNSTISIATDCRLYAALYDRTIGSEDFIKADDTFALDGFVRGTPGATQERRYKVLLETDRGYSILSDELVIAAAPTNASFNSGVDVYLTWTPVAGIIRARIFRFTVTGAIYDELRQVTSGSNTYADNGVILDAGIGGYPSASDDRVKCYAATPTNALSQIAIDGVALRWDGLFLNIPVPAPLEAAASGKQVLRLGLTKALDRLMIDVVSTAASNSVASATGAFTASDTGRTATLYAADGVTVLHGPETITFVDATHVTFATNVATSNVDVLLFIEGGGDHGLLLDMIHIGYIDRATYAPYFEDLNRPLASSAAPSTSGQGGIGPPGGSGDPGEGGIVGCVEVSTPITFLLGNDYRTLPWKSIARGMFLRSGDLVPNWVVDTSQEIETDNLHLLRTENKIVLPCSPKHVVFRSFLDRHGVAANRLKKGDVVLTCNEGKDECSPIVERIATGKRAKVGTFSLHPGHKFLAGWKVVPWWKRVLYWLIRYRVTQCSGIYSHNRKSLDGLDQF